MAVTNPLIGKYVVLRPIDIDDAQFALDIRQDPRFTKYLPKLDITIEQQKSWIASQREKADDYFFIVFDKESNRIGTFGVYDFNGIEAEGGRLTMLGDSCQSIEAGILLFDFCFDVLKLERIVGYVYESNKRALRYNKIFGKVLPEVINKYGVNTKKIEIEAEEYYKRRANILDLLL